MKFEIFKFKKIVSTNNSAINLIKYKKKMLGFVYADAQTRGRGTFGKKWISKKGNFFGSIFFPLKMNYPPSGKFSIINAVIMAEIIKSICKGNKVNLKFPNDIFLNNKKICGVLQEIITIKEKKFLIVGVGLNVVSNPKIRGEYQATNIFKETSKKPKIRDIVKLTISAYKKFFANLNSYNYLQFKNKANLISLN